MTDPMVGRRVGNYVIVARLGAGGGGVVYRALDSKLKRTVALKFLPPDDQTERARFLTEARASSALDHPNIGTIHSIEEDEDGRLFIVMAFYEGETLAKKMTRGPLPAAQAIELVGHVAEGLAAAHAQGIIHRDIKPANIMVARNGAVKILDFGLAQTAGGDTLTRTGTTIGTPAYMSPEQAAGSRVDHRSDIWSLGVVLYEALTGKPPFRRENVPATMLAITNDPPAPMERVSPELQAIIHRCLAKDPAQRYQSAEELRRELQGQRESLTQTLQVSAGNAGRAAGGRPWKPLALGAVLTALLAIGGWFATARWRAGAVSGEKHIVVLPLTNIGGDPANAAICDGLLETLTNRLSTLEGMERSLWVAPASEVRRRNIADPATAKKTFGANLVVTGSVQRGSTGVRLRLSLVDTRTLQQLGSALVDDRLGDFASIEDAAVAKLAKMLEVGLRPSPPPASAIPGAYEAYLKGVSFLQRYDKPGNLDNAIGAFQDAVTRDPRFALACAKLGESQWVKSQSTKDGALAAKALANCEQALGMNDRLAPVHVILGRIHAESGKYDLAVEQFQRALDLSPRDAEAHRRIATAYEAQGRTTDAEASLQKAVALRPDYWDSYNALGAFYGRRGAYKEAAEQYRRVIELTPDNAAGYSNLGAMLNRLGDIAGARAAFESSIRIAPTYPAYGNLARAYYGEGRYTDAAAAYEKALQLNDKDYRVWAGLGAAYRGCGAAEKGRAAEEHAAQLLEDAVVQAPNDAAMLGYLSFLRANLGDRRQAESRLASALALAPNDRDVLYMAAIVAERLGDRRAALERLRTALGHGYPRANVERDPDMASLRKDPAYARIPK